jgi:hypothetical protein
VTTETDEELGPCVFVLYAPCCDSFVAAEHHENAPQDCTCDRRHHPRLQAVVCGLDAVWHGEHPSAPEHEYVGGGAAIRG